MVSLANRHDAESNLDVLLLLVVLLGRQSRTLRCASTLIFTSMAAQQQNIIIPIPTPLHCSEVPASASAKGFASKRRARTNTSAQDPIQWRKTTRSWRSWAVRHSAVRSDLVS
jgi:hypothetical protein